MKTISFLLLTIGLLLFTVYASFAQQNRWTYVANDVNDAEFFIDQKSVENVGKNLRVWHKTVYKDGTYRISLLEWDCTEKKFFVVDDSTFEADGRAFRRDKGNDWLLVTPESINEGLYKVVCSSSAKNNDRIAINSVKVMVQIIVKNVNVRNEPDMSSNVVRKAKLGEKFILVDENPTNGWYQIIISGTKNTGWIHGNTIKLIEISSKANLKKRRL